MHLPLLCAGVTALVRALDAVISGERYSQVAQISQLPDLETKGHEMGELLVGPINAFDRDKIPAAMLVELLIVPFVKLIKHFNKPESELSGGGNSDSQRCQTVARTMIVPWLRCIQMAVFYEGERQTDSDKSLHLEPEKRFELVEAMVEAKIPEVNLFL